MCFRSHPITAAYTRAPQPAARITDRFGSIPSAMVTSLAAWVSGARR
jgi:hypothetical protein